MSRIKSALKSLTKNKEVLTTATTSNSNSSASSTLNVIKNKEVLTTTTVTSNSSILKYKSNNVFPPMEIKFSSQWKHYLPDFEESTKVENLNWSGSHEKAFKELSSLTCKMDLSTKNMDKISYLLNKGDENLIKDLFETNKELFFNEGELEALIRNRCKCFHARFQHLFNIS